MAAEIPKRHYVIHENLQARLTVWLENVVCEDPLDKMVQEGLLADLQSAPAATNRLQFDAIVADLGGSGD